MKTQTLSKFKLPMLSGEIITPMKSFLIVLVTILLLLIFAASASAQETIAFGPTEYSRSAGPPGYVHRNIPALRQWPTMSDRGDKRQPRR